MKTDDVIKAVECCEIKDCHECPCRTYTNCMETVMRGARDLINRQKAEIEGYGHLEVILNTAVDVLAADIKSKEIKKFAERLCNGRVSNDPVVIAVNCALEEMTEE